MKILQLTNKLPYPAKDGGALAIRAIAEGLAACGHEVVILAMNTKKHYVPSENIPVPPYTSISLIPVDVPADTSPFSALSNLLFSNQPYNLIRFISSNYKDELSKLLDNHNFDVAIFEGLYVTPYLPVFDSYPGILKVYRAHNIESEIWNRLAGNAFGFLRQFYFRNLAARIEEIEDGLMNRYDALLPITDRDAATFAQKGNKMPVLVVPAGIPAKNLPLMPQLMDKLDFFHLGALDWAPNQEGILWFLEQVWLKHLEVHADSTFHLAGRNAPSWLVHKLNKVPGLVYHGEVESASEFMAAHHLMVVPLLSGSGMRVKIAEGMMAGKCVLATSIGLEGIPAVHGEQVLVAESAQDFLFWMNEVIENQRISETIGRQAAEFAVNQFDAIQLAANLSGFLHNLLRTKSSE